MAVLVSCWAQQTLFGIRYAAALVVLSICFRLVEDQQMHGGENACLSASTQACGHIDLQHTRTMLATQAHACSHSEHSALLKSKVGECIATAQVIKTAQQVCSAKIPTALYIKSFQNLSYAATALAARQKAAQPTCIQLPHQHVVDVLDASWAEPDG